MEFFARTSFPAREQFSGRQKVELGCPQCQALKKKGILEASEEAVQEMSCSKCKRKKKAVQNSFLVKATDAPSDLQPLAGSRMGQITAAPTATIPAAIPAPSGISPWVIGAGVLGVLGLGLWAANS